MEVTADDSWVYIEVHRDEYPLIYHSFLLSWHLLMLRRKTLLDQLASPEVIKEITDKTTLYSSLLVLLDPFVEADEYFLD